MIFCRRFRACSGLGSPSFVVMVRRMCGFTSPSRSASRVRPLGAGLLPGSPPWGVSRRALRQAGPFAGLSAGACVPGPALRRRPLAGSPPWGVSRRALRQAGPFGGSFGRSVCPGSGPSAPASCRVSAVGRVSPRTPAGGTLRRFFRPERVSRVRPFGAGLLPGLRRGACLAAHSGRRNPLAGLLAGACIPGPALRRRPFAGVSAVGRVSPRTPAGGTLRGSFRRNDLSKQGRPHKADGLRNVACRVICVSLPPARSLRRYRLCGCR